MLKPALLLSLAWATLSPASAADRSTIAYSEHTVVPAQEITPPCLSAAMDEEVSVLIPEAIIEQLIAERPEAWNFRTSGSEEQRMAHVWGNRARLISILKSPETDSKGCHRLTETDRGEANHLIAKLLEEGRAAISVSGQPHLESVAMVRTNSCPTGPAGFHSYYLEGRRPFLILLTCIV